MTVDLPEPSEWIAMDTETAPTTPSVLAPPLACLSWSDGVSTGLHDRSTAIQAFATIVESGAGIVGHRTAYDMAVLMEEEPELTDVVFDLYEQGRVRDTKLRELLNLIESGEFEDDKKRKVTGLGELAKAHCGMNLDKGDDSWQMRYGELIGVPLADWPKGAIAYASTDPLATHRVFEHQRPSPDEIRQNRAAFALHLMGCETIQADPEAVEKLSIEIEAGVKAHEEALSKAGDPDDEKERILVWERKKKKGAPAYWEWTQKKKVLQAYVELAYERAGLPVPQTSPAKNASEDWEPQTSTDRDTLEGAHDPILDLVVERGRFLKERDFCKVLYKASAEGGWCPPWNPLVATGRTSCGSSDDPGNLQNQPRKGAIRECFIPKKGKAFISCDYDIAELRSWAQVCFTWFGYSELREVFLRDGDPHVEMAADLYGIARDVAYELHKAEDEEFGEKRQFAKIPNFGLPGGLGKRSFCDYSWSFGKIKLAIDERIDGRPSAIEAIAAWKERWPEAVDYFAVFTEICGDLGPKAVEQFISGRVRGGLRYPSGCNTMFQGLTADAAKEALWEVTRRCYTVPTSALYGCRPVLFIHDEIILECPIEQVHEAALELEAVMTEVASRWTPDVPQKATAKAMMRWYKKAKRVTDKHGRLRAFTEQDMKELKAKEAAKKAKAA